jgi:hypothetical protein
MQPKKPMNMMIFVLLLVGAFIAYIFSSMFMRGCQSYKPELLKMAQEELKPYSDYLTLHSKTPENYVLELFQKHEIVFLGDMLFFEMLQAKQHVDLVNKLLPGLYKQGVSAIAIFNVLAEDQKQIDTLLVASEFDEQAVHKLLFNRSVTGGYDEYVSLFRTVWSLNSKHTINRKPLRIIGLSPKIHYEYLQGQKQNEDAENPELYKKVFGSEIIDDFILHVIEKEIVAAKGKALIFIPQEYCFIRYFNKTQEKKYNKLGLTYKGSTAYQLYQQLGDRCVSVLLHMPWWSFKENDLLPDFPADGIFDLLLASLAPANKQNGFTITNSPFENWVIKKTYALNIDYMLQTDTQVMLKDLCDGYILLGPLSLYQNATPIPNFINEANVAEALRRGPWSNSETLAKAEKVTAEDLNKILKGFPDVFNNLTKYFSE